MTSYKYLIQQIEAYVNAHPTNPKYFHEFQEQLGNLATKDEFYPLVFVAPIGSDLAMNMNNITLEVYCLDLLTDGRENTTDVVNEMWLLLNDIFQYFNDNHPYIGIVGGNSMSPLNNYALDYLSGWVGTFTFEVPANCDNLINLGN